MRGTGSWAAAAGRSAAISIGAVPPNRVPSNIVRVRVPAKVNLHLGVGGLRPDGFHELVTVFHAVGLYDVVTVQPAESTCVRVSGPAAAGVPTGPDNLVWRAAALLSERRRPGSNVRIEIDKQIPVAGGMAGGSADAAAALLGCARLWGCDPAELAALAPRVGSDVAFGLAGGTALGTGRGELLEPLPSTGELHWVLAPASFGIAAGDAYRELDRLRAEGAVPAPVLDVTGLRAALASGRAAQVAAALHNDLEPACLSLAPALRGVLAAGREAGALAGIVSGSGPTCAFLCADEPVAHQVADALPGSVVTRGPVPGATVLA